MRFRIVGRPGHGLVSACRTLQLAHICTGRQFHGQTVCCYFLQHDALFLVFNSRSDNSRVEAKQRGEIEQERHKGVIPDPVAESAAQTL